MSCDRIETPASRREFLQRAGCGFGAVALAALMPGPLSGSVVPLNPVAAKIPHHRARAKNVIFLFMEGGPSHLDTFDYKPLLNQLAGQRLPDSFKPGRPCWSVNASGSSAERAAFGFPTGLKMWRGTPTN